MDSKLSRRKFLGTAAATAALGASVCNVARAEKPKRPNIIYIYTDQQSATMMSCAGNKWLKTPAMDYIAKNGIRFERAYTTNPVCSPARLSLMTGRFPGSFDYKKGPARENHGAMAIKPLSDEVKKTTLAAFLKQADYELAYGGKTHLPGSLQPKTLGFKVIAKDQRDNLADACANYIKQKHDKPYFLIASFINPHDICFMALRGMTFDKPMTPKVRKNNIAERKLLEAMKLPDGVSEEEFFAKHCPPLPKNYEPQKDEPKAIESLLTRRAFRMSARKNYTDKDWRLHRWAYLRLTEVVDRQIQVVLDALKASGQEENTVVIFSSDHGDMDSAHRAEHKTLLYEESARIPFMIMHKGQIPAGAVDDKHLVSNGLDLLPTVCDYAGVKAQSDPRGLSVKQIAAGKSPAAWRTSLGVESEIGRMVVGDKCKLIKYDAVGDEEQLLDLKTDPFETRHFTNAPSHKDLLAKMRKEFKAWFPKA
ncbi:MAG: sulfatase-like hydrolase/transferase [Phycisphaerales bacterium]|jgi:arylsulfatase A-like enzyme|nr:sulfatase-like hydrolase/transferase [Phycisphaerales bacterium]